MTDQYDFRIPTEDAPEDDLEQIVREFSTPEPQETEEPEVQEEFSAPVRKKSFSVLKVIGIICAVLVLAAAAVVGITYYRWNQQYQASQPDQKSVEAFSLLFKDPDWALLYTMAGIEDTPFENRDAFARYMNTTAGGQRLSYLQLPQTDPLVRKYAVFHNNGTIGTFTMVGTEDAIPDWSLGQVELYFQRTHSVTVKKSPDHIVYINGVALDDSYTIRSISTAAEDFLPQGVHSYRMDEQLVTGLLMEPSVTVTDASGNPVPMVYDSDTHTYSPMEEKGPEIADSHVQFALDAAKASAAFAVRANSFTDLRQFFDPNSNAYEAVCNTAPLLESCAEYKFDPSATQVTNYRSYGSSLFSATVSLKLDATMENGDAYSFDLCWHYLYKQNYTGNFQIIEISDQSFHTVREQVRLTFIHEGTVVESTMVDAHDSFIKFPRLSAPEGKVSSGWAQKLTDSQGNETMAILFVPSSSGIAYLPAGSTLEPMTLYAVYEPIY